MTIEEAIQVMKSGSPNIKTNEKAVQLGIEALERIKAQKEYDKQHPNWHPAGWRYKPLPSEGEANE